MAYIYLLVHRTHEKFKIEKAYSFDQSYALLNRYWREFDYEVSYRVECSEIVIDRFYETLNFTFENSGKLEWIDGRKYLEFFDISCFDDLLIEINKIIAYRKHDTIRLDKGVSIQQKNAEQHRFIANKNGTQRHQGSWLDAENFNNLTLQELYEWLECFESNIKGIWKYANNTTLVLDNQNNVLSDKKKNVIPYSCLKLPDQSWDIFVGGFYSPEISYVFLKFNLEKCEYLENLCKSGQCTSPSLRVISNIISRIISQSTKYDQHSTALNSSYLTSIKKEKAFWNKMYGSNRQ